MKKHKKHYRKPGMQKVAPFSILDDVMPVLSFIGLFFLRETLFNSENLFKAIAQNEKGVKKSPQ